MTIQDGAETDRVLTELMGKDVEARFKFIMERAARRKSICDGEEVAAAATPPRALSPRWESSWSWESARSLPRAELASERWQWESVWGGGAG